VSEDGDDEVDFGELRRRLSDAVREQARAALHHVLVAGTLFGFEAQSVAAKLATFATAELEDTRRLIEKAVALGCQPLVEVERLEAADDARAALAQLRDHEKRTLVALHAVIPETGQEEWSEALEHLLEHIIMRKQEQVDYLARVLH
jgi:hypothetical protein